MLAWWSGRLVPELLRSPISPFQISNLPKAAHAQEGSTIKSFIKQFQAWLQQRKTHGLCVSTSSKHPETKLEVRCFHRSRPDTPTRNASNGDLQGHKETGTNPTHWRAQHYWLNSLRSLHFACVHFVSTVQLHCNPGYHSKEACGTGWSFEQETMRKPTGNFNQFCAWTSSENLIYIL